MQKLHTSRQRSAKQDVQRLNVETERLQDEVDKLEPIAEVADRLKQCEAQRHELKLAQTDCEKLRQLIDRVKQIQVQRVACQQFALLLKRTEKVPELEPTQELSGSLSLIAALMNKRKLFAANSKLLGKLKTLPTLKDASSLREHLSNRYDLERHQSRCAAAQDVLERLTNVPKVNELSDAQSLLNNSQRIVERIKALGEQKVVIASEEKQVNSQIDRFLSLIHI